MRRKDLNLTKEELEHMIRVEKIIPVEIGKRYGVSTNVIKRLMKENNVKTLEKWERYNPTSSNVEPLEGDLRSLLFGSVLGDAGLSFVGSSTRLNENHCVAQKDYMQWKANLWGLNWCPKGMYPSFDKKRDLLTYHIRTIAHPLLNDVYFKFYTGEKGTHKNRSTKEILDVSVVDEITPMALAIWYLDDGTPGHFPNISFGMKEVKSHEFARAIFQKFDLNVRWKPEKDYLGSFQIGFQGDDSGEKFFEIISPHVPDCMKHKLQWGNHVGEHNVLWRHLESRRCWIENAVELGIPLQKMKEELKVSVSAIKKFLRDNGLTPERADKLENLLTSYDVKRWKTLDPEQKTSEVEKISQMLKIHGFPKDRVRSIRKEWDSIQGKTSFLNDKNEIRPSSNYGLAFLKSYFPGRYKAKWRSSLSSFEAWGEDAYLKRAITNQLNCGDPVAPGRVLRQLCFMLRTPTLFRPSVMKFLCEKYSQPGEWVWDPCMGYGGRLFGALSSGRKYVGTEILEETFRGNQNLYRDLVSEFPHLEGMADLRNGRAQDFEFPEPLSFVFTSPPYYNTENYDGVCETGGSYQDWLGSFLQPVVSKSFSLLKSGGFFSMNVAPVKERGIEYNIPEDLKRICLQEGFIFESEMKMPLSGKDRFEPILVFQKP